jgi:hypothetical protein
MVHISGLGFLHGTETAFSAMLCLSGLLEHAVTINNKISITVNLKIIFDFIFMIQNFF